MADAVASSTGVRRTPGTIWAAAAALSVLHLALAVGGTWNKGATFDETAYVGNGYSFWASGDYRMSPDAILPQRITTLPLYLGTHEAPKTDDRFWLGGDVWNYGTNLLFRLGNDGQAMLRTARFMTTLMSVALGWITFLWARSLFGDYGGLIALALYALNPNVLAHGSSVTSDLAAALAFTGATWALWRVIHNVTPWTVAVSCLAVAGAFVTKFSALLLIPIGLLMALLRLVGGKPLEVRLLGPMRSIDVWWKQAGWLAGLVAAHVVTAAFVIWAMFGFRYEMFQPLDPTLDSQVRAADANTPWEEKEMAGRYPVNCRRKGTVVSIAPDGALIKLDEGIDGHLSNVQLLRVKKSTQIGELVPVGGKIEVFVHDVDIPNKRLVLGLKRRDMCINGDWSQVLTMMTAPLPHQPQPEKPLLPGDRGPRNGLFVSFIETARELRLLPEGYLYVFASSISTTAVRSAFLNGRYGIYGFTTFFPYCFLYKTPIAAFFLMALAIAAGIGRHGRRLSQQIGDVLPVFWRSFYATSPLWILLVVYWFTSITRGINIGVRHIVPTFPAFFILTGLASLWLTAIFRRAPSRPNDADANASADATAENVDDDAEPFAGISPSLVSTMKWLTVGCLVWLAGDTLTSYPNYLAYFNRIAGGSDGGYHHLVDSSLDWGQELPNLKTWLDENIYNLKSPPKVYASYFGSTPPSVHGLTQVKWLPCYFPIEALEPGINNPTEIGLEPGVYCISASMLQCVYNIPFAGPWRDDFEHNYQVLLKLAIFFVANKDNQAACDAELKKTGLPDWNTAIRLFEGLRFGRLCGHLRRRPPDASINHAIFIYRLTADELQQALLHPPVEHYPPPAKPTDNVPY